MLPSRQRAHAVRLAHAGAQLASGRKSWPTPDVLPLSGWLRRQIERHAAHEPRLPRLLTPVEEWWLWRQCTLEATFDLPLLDRSALAQGLQQASELACLHHIDMEKWPALPGSESAWLCTVQAAVHARAQALGAGTVPQFVAHLPGLVSRLSRDALGRPVIFSGFVLPAPQLLALAASRPLEAPSAPQLAGPGEALGVPQVLRAADEEAELAHIAQWCRSRLEANSQARLIVMLPGSPGRSERLAGLIRQSLDPGAWLAGDHARELAAIEGGDPLARAPAVAHALNSLALLSGQTLEPQALSGWCAAPYLSHGSRQARAVGLEGLAGWLAGQGALQWSLKELLTALAQAPRPLAGAARTLARRLKTAGAQLQGPRLTMRQWAEGMREALGLLGWPGARARDSGEEQTVARFRELLDEAGGLTHVAGQVSREAAVQWLAALAASTAFKAADTDPVVTISAQLIDPVVSYDALWVAGLTADSFPLPVHPDPYLPLPAQRAARVPSASAGGRLQEAHALLAAWRAASPDLTLSAPVQAGDLALLPSPLLAGWPRQEPAAAGQAVWLPLQLHRAQALETLEDGAGQPWPKELPLPAGTRALDLTSQCPFRAYAELRLGARQLRPAQPGVTPDVRGQLLHGALERFWVEVRDSARLAELSAQAEATLIKRCVAASSQALETGRGQDFSSNRALARERERACRLIARLVALERERAPFKVEATELESCLTLGERTLAVRIDRIDVLPGGGRAVLDYKSGRRTTADWYGSRPSHPQLLTYLAAAGPDVVAFATVNINARELRFDGVAQAADLLPKVKAVAARPGMDLEAAWDEQRRAWLVSMNQLAARFAAGEAQVDPRPGACEHCHLAGLCRISERGLVSDDEDAQERGPAGQV